MQLRRLCAPARAVFDSSRAPQSSIVVLDNALASLRISHLSPPRPNPTYVRHASHQAQGRANGAKDGPGKRLGAKKSGEQYVIPGNIIFRQRGTHWFPGDNCSMGRDHTIHAAQPGYVKYYRDPLKHPKRQYIGVVFERNQTLPQPPNAVRRRRLGMLAYQMEPPASSVVSDIPTIPGTGLPGSAGTGDGQSNTIHVQPSEQGGQKPAKKKGKEVRVAPTLRPGYQYRQANWEIGRSADEKNKNLRPYRPNDRFAAWRKANARKAKNAERRSMRGKGAKRK
ncbi:54S ribosomal protein L2 mitochondrial [Elasticomyces elasticus]|nr:54S ribosomal protein L2 mitochondrial [Elasticomyces elasticus]